MVKVPSAVIALSPICLQIDGHLGQAQLAYLDDLIHMAKTSGVPILLDLHNVVTLDAAAIRYLLRDEGTKFELACPGFIRQLFQQEVAIRPQGLPDSP